MVTKYDVRGMLEGFGIENNAVLTLHTSLRAIGEIKDGADGLIDSFIEYLSGGLFLVPTHTWASVGKNNPVFDVKATEPCTGTLSKVAFLRSDGVRSLHPTHSLKGFGKGAREYLSGEEKSATPCPVGGALSRLYDVSGKILLIGVGHERNTYLHAVDEMFGLPDRINPDTFTATIIDENGKKYTSPQFHTHTGNCWDYYPNYKKAFEYTGAVKYEKLGNALVYCCDARKMTDTVAAMLKCADYDMCSDNREIPERYYKNI